MTITVAAADSHEKLKARADLVCEGSHDERVLRESIDMGAEHPCIIDINPATQVEVRCLGRHRVTWLPGTYSIDDTLTIPDAADFTIDAEGTFFRYEREDGDAVVVEGANRCRYRFGTIESRSSGAAIALRPTTAMPTLMSIVSFTGLIGHGQRGIGLLLDPTHHNVCVNRFEGTDIYGFDTGVRVHGAGAQEHRFAGANKCDTNWYWFSYIRMCNTCIQEGSQGVDTAMWFVNADASIPGSDAVRIGGRQGYWSIIMGQWTRENTRAVVLEEGAIDTLIHMHPESHLRDITNLSGNETNAVISAADGVRKIRLDEHGTS